MPRWTPTTTPRSAIPGMAAWRQLVAPERRLALASLMELAAVPPPSARPAPLRPASERVGVPGLSRAPVTASVGKIAFAEKPTPVVAQEALAQSELGARRDKAEWAQQVAGCLVMAVAATGSQREGRALAPSVQPEA
jgi:hypothetical protein